MSYDPIGPIAPPLHVQFDDNRLVPMLFGEHDQHLARIERELGVSMVGRGNQLTISGSSTAVATARQVMTALYQRLKRGLAVDKNEVDAALRMAASERRAERSDGRSDEATEPNLFGNDMKDGTAIRTQRKHITPRSAAQARYIKQLHEREMVFGIGPAGTGKTYLAVAVAVAMLMKGSVDRIILSRP
ncbi:MAG TPA: PhoH family protein, partial [Terriglobia bacterium]|nr:PhoH family protein [Terriglobia bacterium]